MFPERHWQRGWHWPAQRSGVGQWARRARRGAANVARNLLLPLPTAADNVTWTRFADLLHLYFEKPSLVSVPHFLQDNLHKCSGE